MPPFFLRSSDLGAIAGHALDGPPRRAHSNAKKTGAAMVDKPTKTKSDEPVLDKRLTDRLIQKGLFTREEVEKKLASLPDLTDQVDDIGPMVFGKDT
jgi:hypothetical protein